MQCTLEVLMDGAKYGPDEQQRVLTFVSDNVAPFLGPRPTSQQSTPQWKSFMTDDFSPLEYSWSWEACPKIRFSFEPIGYQAGTPFDPFNRITPLKCTDRLRVSIPNSNWEWFDLLKNLFYEKGQTHQQEGSAQLSSPSSIFLAFDIGKQDLITKAYLVPVKAEQMSKSRLSILDDAMTSLAKKSQIPAYSMLSMYLHSQEDTQPFHIIGVAVDCIHPSISKLKIYLRRSETSFKSIVDTLAVGGRSITWNEKAISELRKLWKLVLQLPDGFPDDQEPTCKAHETSGILYNFDIKKGNEVPKTKVYIPVKHYGMNDRAIAEGLVKFQNQHGYCHYTNDFMQTVEALASYPSLSDSKGLQSYIACSIKGQQLSITSYFSAEIYHPTRQW
jgi:DMATS type aromatic prenyltransferase